jgi:hypothetical protein
MAGMFHLEDGASTRMLNGRVLLAATDAATGLSAAQSVHSIVTMTPTTSRAVTTATAAQILAELSEYRIGSTFEVTLVNLAGSTAPMVFTAGDANVTIVGVANVTHGTSGTFVGRVATATTIVYYRS